MIRQDEVVSNHGNVYLPKQFLQESETAQKAVELFLANPAVVDIAQPLERVKHSLSARRSTPHRRRHRRSCTPERYSASMTA